MRISVVTICYNAAEEIEETLLSILQQTYVDVELIIKDGNSEDGTQAIIERIIERYKSKNIIYTSKKDQGIFDAMNQAIKLCSGDWVNFMNAGDRFYSEKVINKVFEKDICNAGVIYGEAIVEDKYGNSMWKGNHIVTTYKMPFCHQACFIKRELLEEYPFDLSYKIGADYNLILELYLNNEIFFYAGEIIAIYNLNGISSTNYKARLEEQIAIKINQGCLPASYKESVSYKWKVFEAQMKLMIDKYCPEFLYGFLRNIYKIYFKKYTKIEL